MSFFLVEEGSALLWMQRNKPGFKAQPLRNTGAFPGYSLTTLENYRTV